MKLGLFGINMGPSSRPESLIAVARAAEEAGFESLWAGEHVVLPDPQVAPSPMAPQDPALDPLVALAWAAAHTSALRLATGIVILPQRNPVVLAKQVASLDVLSDGRLVLGVGVGYLEPEFRAIGADFEHRGAVTDEYLDSMEHLWYDAHPEFHGRFADFAGVDAYPLSGAASDSDRGRRAYEPCLPARRCAWPGLVRIRAHSRERGGCSHRAARGRVRHPAARRAGPARDHGDTSWPAHSGYGGGVRGARRRSACALPAPDSGRRHGDDRVRTGGGRGAVRRGKCGGH